MELEFYYIIKIRIYIYKSVKHDLGPNCLLWYMQLVFCLFVWIDSLRPINNISVIKGRVFLGWTSTKLGLMFLLKDTMQWRRWGSNPRPFGLKSSTLPLSHYAPICNLCYVLYRYWTSLCTRRSQLHLSQNVYCTSVWKCSAHESQKKFKVMCTPLSGVVHMGCTLCQVFIWLHCIYVSLLPSNG